MARAQQPQNTGPSPAAEPPSILGGAPPIAGANKPPAHAIGDKIPSADGKTYGVVIDATPPEEGAAQFDPAKLSATDGSVRPRTAPPQDYTAGVPREAPPVIKRWVVTHDTQNHSPRLLRGKVVDTLNYDVKALARNGVRMIELKDGQDAADVLMAN